MNAHVLIGVFLVLVVLVWSLWLGAVPMDRHAIAFYSALLVGGVTCFVGGYLGRGALVYGGALWVLFVLGGKEIERSVLWSVASDDRSVEVGMQSPYLSTELATPLDSLQIALRDWMRILGDPVTLRLDASPQETVECLVMGLMLHREAVRAAGDARDDRTIERVVVLEQRRSAVMHASSYVPFVIDALTERVWL